MTSPIPAPVTTSPARIERAVDRSSKPVCSAHPAAATSNPVLITIRGAALCSHRPVTVEATKMLSANGTSARPARTGPRPSPACSHTEV
jgi:hypothetical protein